MSEDKAATKKTPAQQLGERLLAVRDSLVATNKRLEALLASVHGRTGKPPEQPMAAKPPIDYRRFFPAAERLVGEIEVEVVRSTDLSKALDEAF